MPQEPLPATAPYNEYNIINNNRCVRVCCGSVCVFLTQIDRSKKNKSKIK